MQCKNARNLSDPNSKAIAPCRRPVLSQGSARRALPVYLPHRQGAIGGTRRLDVVRLRAKTWEASSTQIIRCAWHLLQHEDDCGRDPHLQGTPLQPSMSYAAGRQHVLDHVQAERKAETKPYRMRNDFSRKTAVMISGSTSDMAHGRRSSSAVRQLYGPGQSPCWRAPDVPAIFKSADFLRAPAILQQAPEHDCAWRSQQPRRRARGSPGRSLRVRAAQFRSDLA